MMTYQEQIKHPKWQKKRLEVLKVHKFKCQKCGAGDEELHVHHPYYKRGAMIWEYDKMELECLCHRCHKDAHAIDEKIKKALALCKNKVKVLDFILNISGFGPASTTKIGNVQVEPDSCRPTPIEKAERTKITALIEELDKEDAAFYAKYPRLKPLPTDSEEAHAEKFFAKMRLMMD